MENCQESSRPDSKLRSTPSQLQNNASCNKRRTTILGGGGTRAARRTRIKIVLHMPLDPCIPMPVSDGRCRLVAFWTPAVSPPLPLRRLWPGSISAQRCCSLRLSTRCSSTSCHLKDCRNNMAWPTTLEYAPSPAKRVMNYKHAQQPNYKQMNDHHAPEILNLRNNVRNKTSRNYTEHIDVKYRRE